MFIINTNFTKYSSFFEINTELEDEEFFLFFHYNFRENEWLMNISDKNRNTLITSILLTPNLLLLNPYRYNQKLPKGDFMILWLKKDIEDKYNEFGKSIILIYITKEELEWLTIE